MAYPYSFIRRIFNVGVGVENLSLERFQTLPKYDGWMRPRYMVQRQLDPQAVGFVKQGQQFQPISLVGNGIAAQGQMELQALAELSKGE